MGKFLHKLGIYAFTNKWRIIIGWILILLIVGIAASVNYKPTTTGITIPGTEAQLALNRVNELFPTVGNGSGRIVLETTDNKKISDYKTQIEGLVSKVSDIDGVNRVVSPFENEVAISSDGSIAYVQVQLKEGRGTIKKATTEAIEDIVKDARGDNFTIEVGGDIISTMPGKFLGVAEIGGVALALIVLVVTLGSLIAAGLPITVALMTIGVSMGGLFALSNVIDISQTTPVLAIMLGLAVGIDYSLFIVNKYRSLLLQGLSKKDAIGRAIGTAGNAVIFAASTVVIALVALSIVNIPFMTTMGLVGAATIAFAALIAVTLIPALLGIVGDKVFGIRMRKAIKKAQQSKAKKAEHIARSKIWYKWGEKIARHPIIALVSSLTIIVILALPIQHLTLGLPTDQYAAKDNTERKAYDILSKGFGSGFNGPLLVVVENLPVMTQADIDAVRSAIMTKYQVQVEAATLEQQKIFEQKAATITTTEGYVALQQEIADAQVIAAAKQTEALAQIEAQVAAYSKLNQLSLVANKIKSVDGVEQVIPVMATNDGTKGIIQIVSKSSPTSQETIDLISYLRNLDNQKKITGNDNLTFAVTGSTALQTDINEKLANALPVYLSIVMGLSLLILIVAFRSILVPIKATIGFLCSVFAMFGCLVAVFQWGWFGVTASPGPIVSFIPIIGIGILFGLAMDYEFFLVSSMHEAYTHGKDAKAAVVNGFAIGSKVVTAAFVIMVSVFAGFVGNDDSSIKAIGFGLAIGILVDALLVRMTIVPAVMILLGKSAWWLPKWLDKLLPHISIEGEEEAPSRK